MEGEKENMNPGGGGILIFKERSKINMKLYARHNHLCTIENNTLLLHRQYRENLFCNDSFKSCKQNVFACITQVWFFSHQMVNVLWAPRMNFIKLIQKILNLVQVRWCCAFVINLRDYSSSVSWYMAADLYQSLQVYGKYQYCWH